MEADRSADDVLVRNTLPGPKEKKYKKLYEQLLNKNAKASTKKYVKADTKEHIARIKNKKKGKSLNLTSMALNKTSLPPS